MAPESGIAEGETRMAKSRDSRWSAAARFVILSVLIGFYGWLHLAYINERCVVRTLEDRGILTSAKVLSSNGRSGGLRNHAQLVRYEYLVGDQWYKGSELVWQGTGVTMPSVSIRYDGSDPAISRLSQSDKLQTLLWTVIIFDLLLGVAGFAIWKERRGGKRLR